MAAGELCRLVGVTGGDHLEQWSVLVDVAGHTGHSIEEQAPDAGGQVVVVDKGVFQVRVVRGGVDGAVHPKVEMHELGRGVPAGIRTLQLPPYGRQGLPIRGRGAACRLGGGQGFEFLAHLGPGGRAMMAGWAYLMAGIMTVDSLLLGLLLLNVKWPRRWKYWKHWK